MLNGDAYRQYMLKVVPLRQQLHTMKRRYK